MKKNLLFIIFLITAIPVFSQTNFTISGFVRELKSEETLPGANIIVEKLNKQFQSNNYGFYSITLSKGEYNFRVSVAGYKLIDTLINLNKNSSLDFKLNSQNQLNEVIVTSTSKQNIAEQIVMSTIEIPIEQIKEIPAILGEKDVFKVIKLLPGIQKGTEGSSGFYVRGGSPDQNLIILDDAVVYNANHLFGFFSLFNGDALKSVELIKGGFPARYGERLSSVLNLNMKDGNKKEFHGEAGFGLLSARMTLEGPIKKDKSSFLISGRRTYADILVQPFLEKGQSTGYYFYDLNTKFQADINDRNRIFISGYFGNDKLYANYRYEKNDSEKANFKWGNATSTFRWNNILSKKLFTNTTLIFSRYRLQNSYEEEYPDGIYSSTYNSSIRDFSLKYDVDYFANSNHTLKFGIKSTAHRFIPNAFIVKDPDIALRQNEVQKYDSYEGNIYVEDEWRLSNKIGMNLGLRASNFNADGANYTYAEPRFSARYLINSTTAIKASYALMHQFLHLLSSTGVGFPTDLWVPSTKRTAPELANQIALGFSKEITEKSLQFSVEAYYKTLGNILSYKEGASFFDINIPDDATPKINYEDNITAGNGTSKGIEFFLQKKTGKLNGWIGYTLSETVHQFAEINNGEPFNPRQDRRHDFSIVALYQYSPKIKLNASFVFSSGNPVNIPRSTFFASTNNGLNGQTSGYRNAYGVSDYNKRGSFRAENYHRADLGIQFYKKKKRTERTFEIGIYNVYSRLNPFFYDIDTDNNGKTKLYKVALFPIVPSVSWSYKF
ncbi:MAG: carboxypeptidase-like regulatory domain-containing protein [Oligoflexus sp.]|nr:carboxypeptidase-like regulatory domain-containing protein [Pseudopedobacter sp.]